MEDSVIKYGVNGVNIMTYDTESYYCDDTAVRNIITLLMPMILDNTGVPYPGRTTLPLLVYQGNDLGWNANNIPERIFLAVK